MIDIKHKYWAINIYLNDFHYLVFYISRIDQVELTRMLQGAKILFFTFRKFMKIVFGPILLSQPKSLLYYRIIAKYIVLFIFYIDNIFKALKIYQKYYIFYMIIFFIYILILIKAAIF